MRLLPESIPPWKALDGNPVHVAEQLGHSVAQLKTHYKALVTKAEAEKFWGWMPRHCSTPITAATR